MTFHNSRSDKIWTCDLYVPNVALYQAEPHAADLFIMHQIKRFVKVYLQKNFFLKIFKIIKKIVDN